MYFSDTLPAGLNFLGPVILEPAGSGSVGLIPPTLASDLALSYGEMVIVIFPVAVSHGLANGRQLINTAAISTIEAMTPTLASVTVTIDNEHFIYLPLVVR